MASYKCRNSSDHHLKAVRGDCLVARDAAFLEIARQKEILALNTAVLTNVNIELSCRAVDAKRKEAAEEIHALRGKARQHVLLRLLRFYLHTRYHNPIIGKPIITETSVRLSFRLDIAADEKLGETYPWKIIHLNTFGERITRVGRREVPTGVNVLTTHPRDWDF